MQDQQESTLEELRAKRAERAAELERILAQKELEAAIREETVGACNEDAILSATMQLGQRGVDWGSYNTPEGIVIVKRPKAPAFKAFVDAGKYTTAACHTLVAPTVFYPARDVFDAWAEKFPGIVAALANVVVELAQGQRKETEGKS